LEFTSLLFSVTRVLFCGVKQLRCEGGQSPAAHAEVKNERSYISPSPRGINYTFFIFIVKLLYVCENGAKHSPSISFFLVLFLIWGYVQEAEYAGKV